MKFYSAECINSYQGVEGKKMDAEEAEEDIRVGALLLAKKIETLGNEKMWDEVIRYFEGRRKEANR